MTQTDPSPNFEPLAVAVREGLMAQGFMRLVGAEVVSVEPGTVVLALERRPDVLQQNGLFHGGAVAFLVDNTTTAAAGTVVDRHEQAVLTAEFKLNFVAPSAGSRLICRASVVKPGRRLIVVEAKVFCTTQGTDKLVAVALATIAAVETKAR